MSSKPLTVKDYIDAAPPLARAKLKQMRSCIRGVIPKAEEGLKWGMPSFSERRMLVAYAAFKHHIGFYPTPSALKAFPKEIAKFKNGKGSIQFPLIKPLPLPLIRKITAFRARESREKDKKWKERLS